MERTSKFSQEKELVEFVSLGRSHRNSFLGKKLKISKKAQKTLKKLTVF